jgi:hypothetical protein
LRNSPHLKPAFVLDEALRLLSTTIANTEDDDVLMSFRDIHSEDTLTRLMDYIREQLIPVRLFANALSLCCHVACKSSLSGCTSLFASKTLWLLRRQQASLMIKARCKVHLMKQ